MIDEFNKCVGNKILGWFLSHPTSSININELSRELVVSPGSVKRFTDLFYREQLVDMEKIGTAHMFTLNNSSYIARELKKTFMVLKLWEGKLEELAPNAISLAVYGSIASGSFDEKSDIDVYGMACFSPDGNKYSCAKQEAIDGGAIAYLVYTQDLKNIDLEDDEILEWYKDFLQNAKNELRAELKEFKN